jgi:hypothetical protein
VLYSIAQPKPKGKRKVLSDPVLKEVIFNAEETDTVFLHYFFIRRTAEGGKKH